MGRRRRPAFDPGAFEDIVDGTKRIYCEKVRPLEETYLVKVRAHTHIHSRMPQQPAPKATCHPTRAIGEPAPAAPPIALRTRALSLLADRASPPSPHTDTSASAHRSAHTTRLRSAFSQDFHYPLLSESDFDAKPMVLLCGQYSTGKTSFIKFLLEREFPGMHFRPPTRFSHMSHPTFPRSHLLFVFSSSQECTWDQSPPQIASRHISSTAHTLPQYPPLTPPLAPPNPPLAPPNSP